MIFKSRCPGKINLFLDVTAKRENGYHDILTLFLPVTGLEDQISIEEDSCLKICCNHSGVPLDHKNLCWKAAEIFAKEADLLPNWKISIEKNLPVAGGMGGGSSNAGAVFNLLSQMFPDRVSPQKLKELALTIGADVPYFLNPVPAIASGVGEDLDPLPIKTPRPMLIVTFDFPISAAWAYQNRQKPFASSSINKEQLHQLWQDGVFSNIVYNDLAFAVRDKFPLLEFTRGDLLSNGALCAEVSGSGPSLFALFDSDEGRDECKNRMMSIGIPESNLFSCFAG
jgi:4-diphosphocytidyl-2-C-methyl-D-erythritol kinase